MGTVSGFIYSDGGRREAGFKGDAGDCVCRAIAIATGRPYYEIYKRISEGNAAQRRSKHTKAKMTKRSASNGVYTHRTWFKAYMVELGFTFHPLMTIGSGCTVHLTADELPTGRLVLSLSRHYCAMINGVIYDTFDPRREVHCTEPFREPMPKGYWTHDEISMHHIARRCVYGYWKLAVDDHRE